MLTGAGDIASCASNGDARTADLLAGIPGEVFTLGDNAYPNGTPEDFAKCYNPTWGRFRDRTHPTIGNHDYGTAGAKGYFDYFGAAAGPPGEGWYSYDLGGWHIVVLNSNCRIVSGGCGAGSPQETWLRADLAAAASRTDCVAAMWHHPLFTSGTVEAPTPAVRPLFQALYDNGAELVLNGHNHQYERFAPQTPQGTSDPGRGIRQFVVGSGGASSYGFGPPVPNSQVRIADTPGVLRLTLDGSGYDWAFLTPGNPSAKDTGHDSCH
ncbi:metallophosphoesterase family protein [Asanoa iriomotensis]|uniref:metallophosphoesterase family protein n=1 Tax=Asanoa iriomotensis TaxID=234613 RepID=UPI001EF389E5|nr:metallophosphoesterase [Asanoa iriomotensis]